MEYTLKIDIIQSLNLVQKLKQIEFIKAKTEEIDKPIIYSEGYNYKFLERAKNTFSPNIDIEIKDCGGKNELQKLFTLFAKTEFNRFHIFFVFDCDAKGSYDACKLLKSNFITPYIFPKNENNKIIEIQSGIENLFDDETIELKEESQLFSITEVHRDGKITSRERKLRKDNFEKYFLEERNEDNDFYNFGELFQTIEEKIKNKA